MTRGDYRLPNRCFENRRRQPDQGMNPRPTPVFGARFRPKKRWGQVFLVAPRIADRLVDALHIERGDVVLEIGAGKGVLTRRLAQKAKRVYAVEIDRFLVAALASAVDEYPNLHIIDQDFLKVDLSTLGPLKIIGNLPYSLSTPILFHLLHHRDTWDCVVLTLQAEFARRLCARPGTKEYGSITVVFELYTRRTPLFSIPPRCFSPRPRVSSTALRMAKKEPPAIPAHPDLFLRVVRASFAQRRKTIANSIARNLAVDKSQLALIQSVTGINLTRRAETLSAEEFRALTDALARFDL